MHKTAQVQYAKCRLLNSDKIVKLALGDLKLIKNAVFEQMKEID